MRRDAGFTLLEVMVALVIAAIALAVLFQGASAGVLSADTAGRYEIALSRARSHLAAIGEASGLAPVNQDGDDGAGFHWALRVAPVASAPISAAFATSGTGAADQAPEGVAGPRLTLYDVQVTISWMAGGHKRRVRLDSRRLGLAASVAG
jgi:general secretion pathway protein I